MRAARTVRFTLTLGAIALAGAVLPGSAAAAFGIAPGSFDGGIFGAGGETFSQAGGHPTEAAVSWEFNTMINGDGTLVSDEADLRETITEVPPGLVGNPNATPKCDRELFFNVLKCPASTQVGVAEVSISFLGGVRDTVVPVYSLEAPHGVPAEFGFAPGEAAATVARAELRSEGDYGIDVRVVDVPQTFSVLAVDFAFWGLPADSVHDAERGKYDNTPNVCGFDEQGNEITAPSCPSDAPLVPFLTNPTDCSHGPFETTLRVISWQGHEDEQSFTSHDNFGAPLGVTGCEKVPFDPQIAASPTSELAESPSRLEFKLTMPQGGLLDPDGIAPAHIKKAEVTLPEGVTANPSAAEGLGVCTEAELAEESATSAPGAGCPNASKIGDVRIKSPLLQEEAKGGLYLAEPHENRFGSLLALYLIAKVPERGVVVKMAGKVEPDPKTGQLITTFDDLPQLPASSFELSFREGARAPLVTPPGCGSYETVAKFTPWSASDPDDPRPDEVARTTTSFQIGGGVNGGPCPKAGTPPFDPGFSAGTLNNNAASHSPFLMRLTRRDGDQDLTRFSAELPPGVVAKLAGVSQCPEAAIAKAKAKRGLAEKASPSCPANSQIGRVLAGAGVGSVLTYVPGKVYLAGPFGGAPISVVAIVPAVAGPFDVGTVVTREALVIDPETAEVRVDGAHSDPIPHILAGIPLKVRDIRVYVDRPDFTLNPTSCDPFAVGAELWGGGADVFSQSDDSPHLLSDRFQAANCSNLGFRPKVSIRLKGGTRRGDFPSLRALVRPRPGDANIASAAVTLPRSAFLEQGHIRTICTRVQFAANACPKGSVYGYARAFTPLLDEPLQGPVYLRSSDNLLPDLVVALKGPPSLPISFDLVGRVDSVKGAIRNTFDTAPDAPVSKFVLTMQGGKKGLVVNSRDLCSSRNRATARFRAQNGKRLDFRPRVVAVGCKKRRAR